MNISVYYTQHKSELLWLGGNLLNLLDNYFRIWIVLRRASTYLWGSCQVCHRQYLLLGKYYGKIVATLRYLLLRLQTDIILQR